MARHILDEMECDEIYHALLGRKADLDKRAKDLEEKDGLPEAAQAVRVRIALYLPGEDGKSPGLLKRFAAQRDLTTEAKDADQERDPTGQQDAFGGGAETGGGPKAGEKGTVPKKSASAKKKGDGKSTAATATVKAADAKADEVTDAEYEIIPEGRRLGGGGLENVGAPSAGFPSSSSVPTDGPAPLTDPKVLDAISRLDTISDALKQGPSGLSDDDFRAEGARVLELMAVANPNMDVAFATVHVNEELRSAGDGNAHALAYFVDRITALLKPEPDMPAPIAASGLSFAKPEPAAPAVVGGE